MPKSVGFRREIKAAWFDAAAAVRSETDDIDDVRRRLDDLLSADIPGSENRAITVQILLRVWAKPEAAYQQLHEEAIQLFRQSESGSDRIWLHYGMCLLAYPFFRDGMGQAGALLRQRGTLSNAMLKQRIIAKMGQLGSLENASRSLMFALRQWGAIVPGNRRGEYVLGESLCTEDKALQMWFLRAALTANQAESLPLGDLLSWSAIFPFRLTINAYDLRQVPSLEIERHGSNLDVVRAGS